MNTNEILRTIAAADPDFAGYCESLPAQINKKSDLPPELLFDVMTILQDDPDMATAIKAYSASSGNMQTYAVSVLAGVGTLAAVVFLLRTHIRIKRNASGQWEFLFEHKPEDNDMLTKVLAVLEKLLSGSSKV